MCTASPIGRSFSNDPHTEVGIYKKISRKKGHAFDQEKKLNSRN